MTHRPVRLCEHEFSVRGVCEPVRRRRIGERWDAARAAVHAAQKVGVPPPAVVGVWNGSSATHPYRRAYEPAPEKVLSGHLAVNPQLASWFDISQMEGDRYLDEVCDHILPNVMSMIGGDVPVAMMGASMGGIATLCALGERPDVFGCGLAFSVHWPFGGDLLVDALVD
jgi:hypothetical protein